MPIEVRKYVPLHFKKPILVTDIVLTRAFINHYCLFCQLFRYFEPDIVKIFVLELGGKSYGNKSFRQDKRNRIE